MPMTSMYKELFRVLWTLYQVQIAREWFTVKRSIWTSTVSQLEGTRQGRPIHRFSTFKMVVLSANQRFFLNELFPCL